MFTSKDIGKSESIAGVSYHTLEDYVQYLVNKGYAQNEAEIRSKPELLVSIQRHWHQQARNGCLFAATLARQAQEKGWRSIAFMESAEELLEQSTLERIGLEVARSIADPQCEAMSFVFGEIRDATTLVSFIHRICALPIFQLEIEVESGEVVLLGLRIPISHDPKVLSWALVFGNYPFFARTRRSPFTELVFRTKLKPQGLHKDLNDDPNAAHLADIDTLLDHDMIGVLLDGTSQKKKDILQGEFEERAKARVSVALPLRAWKSQ